MLGDLPRSGDGFEVTEVVVVDNGSRDRTPEVAREAGATVLHEPQRGYGAACWTGVGHVAASPPDVVVFLDGDYSDHPDELPELLAPFLADPALDMVIGSRSTGRHETGALLPQQRFGNWLATTLIRLLHGQPFTDLGPFRALSWSAWERLAMEDRDFGWTVEMQVKAGPLGLRWAEVPVSYRRRVGRSKIAGTVRGSVKAGIKILWTIARYARTRPSAHGHS